jgi:UDP-2,3-diacylglucosamine hydrolase
VAPSWPVLRAPTHWRRIDFISDLHLQDSEPATFSAWQDYMQSTQADAVFILGDLFEVWIGDDVVDRAVSSPDHTPSFEVRCAQILHAASQRLPIFFMHGNRDFLLGPAFAKACGMTLLNDPTVLDFAGQRWLLSHGDALCLDDTEYMKFRTQVRSAQWQHDFLGQPLTQRQEIARALRTQSETRKRSGLTYADLDAQACGEWLQIAGANALIHGHTHQPADHDLPQGRRRITLSDWDAAATPPRTEVLRLSAPSPHQEQKGCTVERLTANQIRA